MDGVIRNCTGLSWFSENPMVRSVASKQSLVVEAAVRAFALLAAALAVNCTIMTFVAAPLAMVILTTVLIGLLGELSSQLAVHVARSVGWLPTASNSKALDVKQAAFFSELSLVNAAGQAGPTTLFHEAGHAMAYLACFKDARPRIHVYPFKGGVTEQAPTVALTLFGKLLGIEGATILVIAGGIIATMVVAMTALAGAEALKDTHPTLSRILELFGYVQLLGEVLHGLSALVEPAGPSHSDFGRLRYHTGIHPLIIVTAMILLPIAQKLVYLSRRPSSDAIMP